MLLAVGAALAGGADQTIRDIIGLFNDLAATLETSKNADEARPKLEKLVAKFNEIQKKLEANKPSQEEETKLKQKYGEEFQTALKRYGAAVQTFGKRDPDGLKSLTQLFEKMGEKKSEK